MVNTCQWSADKKPYIHIPVGPRLISSEFLIDIGAQISVLNERQASELAIKPLRKAINIIGVTGAAEKCPIAQAQFWLPGEKRMTTVEVSLSPYEGNILGFDVLAGKQWYLPNGRVWSFEGRGAEAIHVRTLQVAPALLQSKVTHVYQYLLPATTK